MQVWRYGGIASSERYHGIMVSWYHGIMVSLYLSCDMWHPRRHGNVSVVNPKVWWGTRSPPPAARRSPKALCVRSVTHDT
jgi:hypothetical protein